MKKYIKYFVYVSLIFLAIALYQGNYLKIPTIHSNIHIISSFLCLFIGFILEGMTWQQTLHVMGYKTRYIQSISSVGLSVFGKYIPGKIWLIAGRSFYIAQEYKYSSRQIVMVSVIAQLISIWVGLLFGIIGVLLLPEIREYGYAAISLWIMLSVLLFIKYPHTILERLLNRIFRREIIIPFIKFNQLLKILPWFLIRWTFFTFSFYLLIQGLTEDLWPIYTAFGFPLAGTLGLIVIIAPGGLGVREGILTAYLLLAGMPLILATSISLASRLWYLMGEIFIFFIGMLNSTKYKPLKK